MALQNFRQFKTKLSSQLKHSACAQDPLCWHKVLIFSPTVPPDNTHTNYLWMCSPGVISIFLGQDFKNLLQKQPKEFRAQKLFLSHILLSYSFFFLYRLTHVARTIPSSCTHWITQPGEFFSVSNIWSLGMALNYFALTKFRGVWWLTQQAGAVAIQVKDTAAQPADKHKSQLGRGRTCLFRPEKIKLGQSGFHLTAVITATNIHRVQGCFFTGLAE